MKRLLLSLILVGASLFAVDCCSNCSKKGELAALDSTITSEVKTIADSVNETVTTPPITATFMGSDGKTRRAYKIRVVFYPSEQRATLSDDKDTYQLKQYVTADGYGYKSKSIDLRGRGQDATLTYSDGLVLQLSEVKPQEASEQAK